MQVFSLSCFADLGSVVQWDGIGEGSRRDSNKAYYRRGESLVPYECWKVGRGKQGFLILLGHGGDQMSASERCPSTSVHFLLVGPRSEGPEGMLSQPYLTFQVTCRCMPRCACKEKCRKKSSYFPFQNNMFFKKPPKPVFKTSIAKD